MVLSIEQSSDMSIERFAKYCMAKVAQPESKSCPKENLVNRLISSVKVCEGNADVSAQPKEVYKIADVELATSLLTLILGLLLNLYKSFCLWLVILVVD